MDPNQQPTADQSQPNAAAPKKMSFNPNARPFSFNPAASTFTPGSFTPKIVQRPAAAGAASPAGTAPAAAASPAAAPAPAPAASTGFKPQGSVISLSESGQATTSYKPQGSVISLGADGSAAAAASPVSPAAESATSGGSSPTSVEQITEAVANVEIVDSSAVAKRKAQDEEKLKQAAEEERRVREEKLKNVDLREHLNLVFIGHVDAGKSTLSGQLLLQTGQVDERTFQKYEKESKEKNRDGWAVAYIMDVSEEEREKGKTVEVSRAHFETKNKRYTILDAPGHKAYVPNMIAGASQADVAVLVISSKRGEFESGFENGGQTREHTTLAKTLGVGFLVVAINKMDDPTVQWSKERYDEIVNKLTPFLRSAGYNPKKQVKFVPIAGLSGANVMQAVQGISWWDSGSLVDLLDNLDPIPRPLDGPLRIPVIDRYKEKGATVILGKVESGTVVNGQKCILMPNRTRVEVTHLQLHEQDVEIVRAGENAQITIKGEYDIPIGSVLCDSIQPPVPIVQEFVAQFVVLDKPIFTAGYSAMAHIHTAVEEVTISKLLFTLDKKTGEKSPIVPKFGKNGDVVTGIMTLTKPVCMEKYDVLAQLGRFTIREASTVMVGKILKIKPIAEVGSSSGKA